MAASGSIEGPCAPVWVLVPAAGAGARVGATVPKQYLELAGEPMLTHALRALAHTPRIAGLVVIVADADTRWRSCLPDGVKAEPAPGGAVRMQSVLHGLQALNGRAAAGDWVLVHDAARPCLSAGELAALLAAVRGHEVGGLLARPVTDTLKRADGARPPGSAATVDREGMWHALTPQVFRYAVLHAALTRAAGAAREATDEAQAVEWMGLAPLLVPGSAANIKVTTAADLAMAERWLAAGRTP